jgi:hypothetical protein
MQLSSPSPPVLCLSADSCVLLLSHTSCNYLLQSQLRELVLTAKRTGLNSTASASTSQLPAAPASPQQQQQQQAAKQDECEVQAAAARAALTGPGPEVPGSNPADPTNPKTGSPQRPSTAPSAVRQPSGGGGGSSGGSAAVGGSGAAAGRYSSLSCDPQDWELQAGMPCSGEALLLMYDRWQKLAKTFYKKGKFDISKVGLTYPEPHFVMAIYRHGSIKAYKCRPS